MKDTLLAERLAAVLKAAADFAAPYTDGDAINIAAEFSGTVFTRRPSLTLSGDYTAYGPRRLGSLELALITPFAAAEVRQNLVAALWDKLIGTDLAKAAIRSALAADGLVELGDFGPSDHPLAEETVENETRTVLQLRVVWRFV